MKLVRYQHPLAESFSDFDRWFRHPSESFGRLFELADRLSSNVGLPALGADLYEDDDHYHVRLELPGVKKEDLKVELHDHLLSVVYERSAKEAGESAPGGSAMKRVVTVPDGIDGEKVSAKLEDGILTVTLPKSVDRKPREIRVD